MGDSGSILIIGGIVVIGGIFAWKFVQNGGLNNLGGAPAPAPTAPVTPAADTSTTPSDVNAIKQPVNQTVINNYKIDFQNKFGKTYKPSNDTIVLFTSFDTRRYLRDSGYRKSIVIVINRMPSKERSYWQGVMRDLDRQLDDRNDDDNRGPPKRPKPKCVQHMMCAMNTHWNDDLCKCVPNTVPSPNIKVDDFGRKIIVDGATSRYSSSTLVNNLGKVNYW